LFALEKRYEGEILRLELATSNLQDGIRRVRMMPFDTVLGGFQRMVRDLARELGKDVVLDVQGAMIELDKKVLEEIRDPLMHLLRNAVGHGIEMPAERAEQGKPGRGTITLTVAHQGSLVSITVEDDGRGIDLQAIRRTALKAGVIGQEELDTLTDQGLMQLTLLPGISTSRQVTDLSGRGIGLDVVRQKVQDLQGRIDIESWPGRGTRFQLTVPVSLATARGLLARIMDEVYVLPLSSIQKIIMVTSDDVHTVEGREMIAVNGRQTALVPLATVLERPTLHSNPLDTAPAVVLQVGATQAAFVVDELLGEQEMIVKGLGAQLVHVRNVAGATLLGNGRVVMILNPAEMIRSIQRDGTRSLPAFAVPLPESTPMPTILVVDDSITTRTLEKNILEAAGYRVITAVDGIEAMGYLASDDCDLVVADVQMPRMNGFELTETIKGHEQFGHLPVILVTSLESQEDRSRGLTAGADAYIVKSAFDQEDLLSTIRQMLSEA
jgi:two-component system chemotaxis sensor kinase CheA